MTGFSTEIKMIMFPLIYFVALTFLVLTPNQSFQDAVDDMNTAYPDFGFLDDPSGYMFNATGTTFQRFDGLLVAGGLALQPPVHNVCITASYCFDMDTAEIFMLHTVIALIGLTGVLLKAVPWIIDAIDAVIPF